MEYRKGPDNFAMLPDEFSNYDKSKVVILPVPYEKTVCYGKGTGKGPEAIIQASNQMETYDDELGEIYECGVCTLNHLEIDEKPEKMVGILKDNVKKLIDDGKFVFTLGGEHSITTGPVAAFKDKYPDLSVLQIDAHSDLREEYEGTKYSHAAVMSRVIEMCPIVPVGIRSLSFEESEFIKEKGIEVFWARNIFDNDDWFDAAIGKLSDNVYITFDVDGLDPSIMPSTGTPEPGGLLYYQTLRFLKQVFERKNVVGCDLVELAPNPDDVSSDFTCSKIIYKMIGYKFR